VGAQFIVNDGCNRSHLEHNGLGKANTSQRVNLTQSLGFSLILLDQDRSHILEHKHCSASKRKALNRGDDSDDSGYDYRRL
jgi:hypothetical protein